MTITELWGFGILWVHMVMVVMWVLLVVDMIEVTLTHGISIVQNWRVGIPFIASPSRLAHCG